LKKYVSSLSVSAAPFFAISFAEKAKGCRFSQVYETIAMLLSSKNDQCK